MKGLVVKFKDEICRAGIAQNGVGLVANITWHSGIFWSLSGLKMPEEIHQLWNGGMLEVGDEIEVELAEIDEVSTPVIKEKHYCPMKKTESMDDSKDLEYKLDLYYRLKKVLEDQS